MEGEAQLVLTRWLLHPDVLEGFGGIPEWEPFEGGRGISDSGPLEEDLAAGAYGRTLLLDGVAELEITYFGIDEGMEEPDWYPEWLEQPRMPLAIRIHLTTLEQSWPDMLILLPQLDQRQNPKRRRGRERALAAQRGIALMLVLWVLALLTIIAVGLTAAQRTETTLAGNQLATVRFRAVSEAAVSFAILNLLAPATVLDEETDVWVPDGMARPWRFGGESLEIQVFNEASRIDLNVAGKELLVGLTAALELPEEEGAALADAVEDWRDLDDFTQLNGAEDDDYEARGALIRRQRQTLRQRGGAAAGVGCGFRALPHPGTGSHRGFRHPRSGSGVRRPSGPSGRAGDHVGGG